MDIVTTKALRRAWVHSHGLGRAADNATQGLSKAGWLHAIAGVDSYLSVRSRYPSLNKADLDALLADDTVRIVSGARGCTMLVPDGECGLALSLSQLVSGRTQELNRQKLEVSDDELARAASAVVELLMCEPLNSREIKKKLPKGLVRALGDSGKSLGFSSTLPMVMRRLEYEGKVGRWPEGDRLDNERYRWDLLDTEIEVSRDRESVVSRAVAHYLNFAGASTISDFAAWSGVGKRDSKIGFESLDLHPFRVDGGDVIVYANQRTADQLIKGVPRVPKAVIVSFREPLVDHRDGLGAILDADYQHLTSKAWGKGQKNLIEVRRLGLRSILVEGALGGVWEYDEESQEVHYALFDKLRGGDLRNLQADLEELAGWLFNTFGHAKFYQMESPRARKARVDAVLALKASLE